MKLNEEHSFEKELIFNFNRKNIVSWYDFNENSSILELNPNFGEITGFLSEIAKTVVSIQSSKTKAKAISDRYKDVSNLEVIVGNLNDISLNQKFDYAVIIGIESKLELKEKIKFSKKYLNENGKILLAFDNKFGLKYWSGVKEGEEMQYSSISGYSKKMSLIEAENVLKSEKLDYKVFYALPDYKFTNVIYSDEYLPTIESISSRDLLFYNKNNDCKFNEREVYTELIKENVEYFKFFANSYFLEVPLDNEFVDTRYVNFEILRKEKYGIKTIIKKDFVYKRANSELAKSHLDIIKDNIDLLKEKNIKTLDNYNDQEIISTFVKDGISLDKYILKVYKESGKDKAIELLKKFFEEILGKFKQIKRPKESIFEKYYIEIETPEKLHFIKNGLIDLCPQNCFYINNEFYIYDQEWYEENVPIEYIMFRTILYNNFQEIASKDELYEIFGLSKYKEVFKELDDIIQKDIRDEHIWNLHISSFFNIEKAKLGLDEEELLKNEIEDLKNENKKISEDLRNAKSEIEDYKKQLAVISNSLSWKITKPLRYISWILKGSKKVELLDKLLPPGSNLRRKYDNLINKRLLIKFKEKYIFFDEETYKYWAETELKYLNEKYNRPHKTNYDFWMDNNDVTPKELRKQKDFKFKYMPKISIITPLYNTDINLFRDLLFFMVEQSYSNWELCLADGSDEPLKEIQKIIEKEPRVKYVYIGENKGISENTNEALKLASGDYIGLLDHDDYLSKDALYEVVKTINKNPNVEFIYSDEDKVTEVGAERFRAYFKPDFSPDSLRSQNYICHFSVLKKELMNKLGGFKSKYDGAQDYDLFLRMTEVVKPENIKHISKILYHWRASKNSTAFDGETKTWAIDAGKLAIEDHLKRIGLDAEVREGKFYGSYEVQYKVKGNPKVSIMIPNKDGRYILRKCVESILEKTTYSNYEINIIENNSTEQKTFDYYSKLEKNPKIKILKYPDKGFNYSKIMNFGAKNCDGDYLIQLNNDTELITPDWIEKMLGFCQREDIGAVGVAMYYPDKTFQHAGVIVGLGGVAAHRFKDLPKDGHGYFAKESLIENLSAVTAACIMTKKSIYEEVGFMNEKLEVAFNDVDFCLRIRKTGKLIVYNPFVEFWHYESKTRGAEDSPKKRKRFYEEITTFRKNWKEFLQKGDPYYNKNLNLDNEQYEIRKEKID